MTASEVSLAPNPPMPAACCSIFTATSLPPARCAPRYSVSGCCCTGVGEGAKPISNSDEPSGPSPTKRRVLSSRRSNAGSSTGSMSRCDDMPLEAVRALVGENTLSTVSWPRGAVASWTTVTCTSLPPARWAPLYTTRPAGACCVGAGAGAPLSWAAECWGTPPSAAASAADAAASWCSQSRASRWARRCARRSSGMSMRACRSPDASAAGATTRRRRSSTARSLGSVAAGAKNWASVAVSTWLPKLPLGVVAVTRVALDTTCAGLCVTVTAARRRFLDVVRSDSTAFSSTALMSMAEQSGILMTSLLRSCAWGVTCTRVSTKCLNLRCRTQHVRTWPPQQGSTDA